MTPPHGTEPASPASEPVVRNPYRVLGLPGDATWAEIRAASRRIVDSPDPAGYRTPWDLPWLGEVPRSTGEVERALARLADPHGRLRSRVFWFHERVAEAAVHELDPATIRNALEGWSSTALEVARHDAAVVALIAAIALDPGVENSALWQRALREWDEALGLEPYWMDVLRVEMEGGFETPASLAEVRDLRDEASELVTEPLLVYAREAVIAEQNPRAARTLAVLREVLSKEAFTERCGDLAEHVWGSFDADWGPRPEAPEEPTAETSPEPESGAPIFRNQNPGMWDFAADSSEIEPCVERSEDSAAGSERDDAPGEEARPAAAAPGETAAPRPEPDAAPRSDAASGPDPATPPPTEADPASPARAAGGPDEAPDRDEPRATRPAVARPDPAEAEPVATHPIGTDPDAPDRPAPAEPAPVADGDADARPADAPERPTSRRAARRSRRDRHRVRPAVAAAAVAAVLLAAVFSPRFRPETEAGAAPVDRVVRADVERRMETIDAAMADALVDRHRADASIGVLRESVDGYQTLVDDYERRIARRLPADRVAYRRVTGLRDEARARLDEALESRAAIDARIDRLSDLSADLVREWNAATVSAGEGTERDPSP